MATQGRDQDVLKAFDYDATAEDPYLTVKEVTAALAEHFGIEVSNEVVRNRLEALRDDETVAKRRFGAGVAYRALVAPKLADDVEVTSNERRRTAREEFVPLEN